MRHRRPVALLATALALLIAAPSAAAAPAVVEMRALSYSPSTVAFAAPGWTIRWRNVTSPARLHDVVSSLPGYFGSGLLGSGETFTFAFGAAGTFTYICSIHDVMLGRVEVAPTVALESDGAGARLRVTLGSASFAIDDDYRWNVFLKGPDDTAFRWRRTARTRITRIAVDQPGEWTVMVRLRHVPTATPSSDSPLVTITVPV